MGNNVSIAEIDTRHLVSLITGIHGSFIRKQDRLKEKLVWARTTGEAQNIRTLIDLTSQRLRLFSNVVIHLPSCLSLTIVEDTLKMGRSYNERVRISFNAGIRVEFFKAAAMNPENIQKMHQMGVNDAGIEFMQRTGRVPANEHGTQLDITADHARDIKFGGTNDFDNLVVMPQYLNTLKEQFIAAQLSVVRRGASILSFAPAANDAPANVVVFPGGFRERNDDLAEQAKRASQLFECELVFEPLYTEPSNEN